MYKNGMRPMHPGEILCEDFLKPAGLTANALARALKVPAVIETAPVGPKAEVPLAEMLAGERPFPARHFR
jgi:plasmid maintenance system antidote protein VapI